MRRSIRHNICNRMVAIAAIISIAVASGCGSDVDDDDIASLQLSCTHLTLFDLPSESAAIEIIGGSGDFAIETDGAAVHVVHMENRRISITPLTLGDATISVYDNVSHQRVVCRVEVVRPFLKLSCTSSETAMFNESSILYLDCGRETTPTREWVLHDKNAPAQGGTFTTSYLSKATYTSDEESVSLTLYSIKMSDGTNEYNYVVAEMDHGVSVWGAIFPEADDPESGAKRIDRSTPPFSRQFVFLNSETDLTDIAATWNASGPVALPDLR